MKRNPIYEDIVSKPDSRYKTKINMGTTVSHAEQVEMYQEMLISLSKSKRRAVEQAVQWERKQQLELYSEIDRLTELVEHKFLIAKPSPWFYFKLFLQSLKAWVKRG